MEKLTIELIPDTELGGFTARVPDIPAYGEGETEEAAVADLKEALQRYIETFGLEDARNKVYDRVRSLLEEDDNQLVQDMYPQVMEVFRGEGWDDLAMAI